MTALQLTRRSLLFGAGGAAISASIAGGTVIRGNRIAVIGAGVFGAWTAHHLMAAGQKVIIIEPWGPAHSRASSGGESRMTRAVYGKDALYTRMALQSLPQWKRLSDASGLPIFAETGVLFFSPTEEQYFRDSVTVHREFGLATQLLDGAAMARRFPMIDFDGISVGLFEPAFGALMARRSVQTLVAQLVRAGAEYVHDAALSPTASGRKLLSLQLASGERVEADQFVFALGPWLPKVFPALLTPRIVPTRQEVFFFAPPADDRRFLVGAMPGWADFNGGDIYYGFPDLEGRGVKLAHDAHGPVVDPDTQSRRPSEDALADVIGYRDRRFPALKGAPLTEARVCQYENSSNGDFLIDFHPQLKNVLLVGGGSGHGFKHGPEVGRYAAARLLGVKQPEPRFSLATKAETQRREVH
ncbi:MAG: FAD-dependent oxidoreductase [Sphingomicrobium sp.]